jgi:ribosomal protein L40E
MPDGLSGWCKKCNSESRKIAYRKKNNISETKLEYLERLRKSGRKICTKCEKLLFISDFHKAATRCRKCTSEDLRKKRKSDPEFRERNRVNALKWIAENPEKYKARRERDKKLKREKTRRKRKKEN